MKRFPTLRIGSWRGPQAAFTDSAQEGHPEGARHPRPRNIEPHLLIAAKDRFPLARPQALNNRCLKRVSRKDHGVGRWARAYHALLGSNCC